MNALRPIRGGNRPAYVVDGDCWIWQGTLNSRGYGCRGRHLVHRLVFEEHVRPLEDGEQVHHRCERKACVNPAHLEAHDHLTHERLHAGEQSCAALILGALESGPLRLSVLDGVLRGHGHVTGAAMSLTRMTHRGEVARIGRGVYALPTYRKAAA